jgi:hypothetical protein
MHAVGAYAVGTSGWLGWKLDGRCNAQLLLPVARSATAPVDAEMAAATAGGDCRCGDWRDGGGGGMCTSATCTVNNRVFARSAANGGPCYKHA